MEFAGVEEIEDLHHDEGVEDEGEVTRVDPVLVEDGEVVVRARRVIEATRADSTANYSVVPFLARVIGKDARVVRVRVFGDPVLSGKDQEENDHQLEDALTNDVFKHGLGDDVLVS